MLVLALDSSMKGCAAAVFDEKKGVLASDAMQMNRGQAEHLIPMIERVLSDAGVGYKKLDLIAVTNGPGAFAGLRVALATANSLAGSLGVPVVGVSTFEAVLETFFMKNPNAPRDGHHVVALDTKRNDFYVRTFGTHNGKMSDDKGVMTLESVMDILDKKGGVLVSDSCERFRNEIQSKDILGLFNIGFPDAEAIAIIALKSQRKKGLCSAVYMRLPEIGVPKKEVRKIRQS